MKGKKSAVIFIALVMVLSSFSVALATEDYGSWDSGSLYPQDVMGTKLLTPVKFLMDKKIITGDADGLFHPEKSITRAEFATMMAKATNNTAELELVAKQNYFNDLSGYDWAKGYINACSKAKLIKGVGNEKFAPGKEVTYAETITIIIRSKNVTDADVGGAIWPNNYITYAQMYNMLGDVTVSDWSAPATKGDVAKLLYRSMPK